MAGQADLRGPALEAELIALWADVTGAQPLSDDDFFQSGGDSIGAARLVALVRERLGAAVELGEFLADPTVAGLRRCTEAAARQGTSLPAPVAEPPSCSL